VLPPGNGTSLLICSYLPGRQYMKTIFRSLGCGALRHGDRTNPFSAQHTEDDMSRTSSTSSAIIRFLLYALLIGLCLNTSARAAVDKTSGIEASGEGSVYDLRATAAGTLRVCTKARKTGDRWRVTITQAITAGGVSGVGTGSTSAFTGCVSQTIALGAQYLVIVTWERPMPGVFPASVIVHFTGPTDATNPPVVGITGTALTAVLARPTSFVETARGCPADGATIACGALIIRMPSASLCLPTALRR
jgi:hypothetical protein